MTLKTVLRNFLNSVEATESRRQDGDDLFEIEFQKLKELTEQLKHHPDYTSHEGELEVNRRKNRYKDILPYDKSRVIISEYPGVPGSDYVNANYVKGASGSFAYIASQGPLPNTVADFWRMIWEAEVQVIVMACNERESGKYKCECYWPNEEDEKERQRQYGNITVELVKWRQVCPDFLVRTLKYRCLGEEERSLCQFHYTTWPDHGVPTTVQPILDMVRLMRDCQASEAVPILIHCSAGCGRTGTICAIDYVWSLMRLGKLTADFNLYDIIADMRRQRIAMVQTKEQYILVHRAVGALFEQQLRVIDNHTYENLDGDGQPLMLKELQEQQPSEHIYEDVRSLMMNENKIEDKENPYSTIEETLSLSTNDSRESSSEPPNGKGLVKRRNSQILQKLCREESVKRLISGWNRAVSDNPEPAAVKIDTPPIKASVTSDDSSLKATSYSEKDTPNEYPSMSSENKSTLGKQESKLSLSRTEKSPPSEKLVGKATVIRRPSIAKLKALFEKSHISPSENNNNNFNNASESVNNEVASEEDKFNRRVRPLGRSHSHHVPRGRISPSQENFESEVRRNVERERSVRRIVSPLAREAASRNKPKGSEIKISGSGTVNKSDSASEQLSETSNQNNNFSTNVDAVTSQNKSSKFGCVDLRSEKKASWYGEHDSLKPSGSMKWYGESESTTQESQAYIMPGETILCDMDANKQPPQLPIKKKSLFRFSEKAVSQLNSDATNQTSLESVSNTSSSNLSDHTQIVGNTNIKTGNTNDVKFDEYKLEDNTKSELVVAGNSRNIDNPHTESQDTAANLELESKSDIPPKLPEKKILGRIASVKQKDKSDTKQEIMIDLISTSSVDEKTKTECYLSMHPELHTSKSNESGYQDTLVLCHKNHPGRKGDTIADRYTNVNLVSQKNIAQIEKTIKHHPRGAIIDLTSRTSFVENPQLAKSIHATTNRSGASHSYSKYATVRCKMTDSMNESNTPLESKFRVINNCKTTSQNDVDNISGNNSQNTDGKNADAIESGYGVLHSPPPRSRRSHMMKSIVKSKSGSDLSPSGVSTVVNEKKADSFDEKEISQDKEINKAVKDLNTIGYLLDALANQTLKAPTDSTTKQEGSEAKNSEVTATEKPVLPVKQRINSKAFDGQIGSRPASERQSVSFPLKQGNNSNSNEKSSFVADSKIDVANVHYVPDYEYIFPLQKSASAPHTGRMFPALNSEHHQPIPPHILKDQPLCRYQPDLCDIISAPPKPPRTFTHVPQNSGGGQLDGGRLLVSVASPKSVTKPEELNHPSKHFNYESTLPIPNHNSQTKPYVAPHVTGISNDISSSYGNDPSARHSNVYLSQPSSPFHNSMTQNMFPSTGNRLPHPSSYRTYPSYPEIHSVRAVPNHIPSSNLTSHRIRQSLSLGYGIHHHHINKGPPPTMTYRRTQPDGLLTPVANVNNPAATTVHQVGGLRPSASSWYYDERNNASATPDYGEIPVAPVYTMVRQDQDRHRVQWDSSVDEQQQIKGSKAGSNYENIYDVPKDCWSGSSQSFVIPHGHELRHSQSDAGVYAALRTAANIQKFSEGSSSILVSQPAITNPEMTQSSSAALNCPLYSQVIKPKKSKSEPVENSGVVVPRKSRRSRDDMDLQPVAPPRSKRQLQLRRSVAGGLCESGYGMDGESTWHSDSEDEPPPAVPEKTKGAYITIDPEDSKTCPHSRRESASAHNGGLGGTLSRALGKLSLLTKLTTSKSEASQPQQPQAQQYQQNHSVNNEAFQKETVVSSSSSGVPAASNSTTNSTNKPHIKPSVMIPPSMKSPNFGFPHRTHRRPKGPREPPEQWTQV